MRCVGLAAISGALVACGGDDDDGGPSCGTLQAPQVVELGNLQPALGSAVANNAIVHAFTILGVAELFDPTLATAVAHTAGMPDPAQIAVALDTSSPDVRYTFSPLRWTTAPSNVELQVTTLFQTQDGCVYAFPDPLFSYSVTP